MCSSEAGLYHTLPLLCAALWTVASAFQGAGYMNTTIGFLLENSANQYRVWDVGTDSPGKVAGTAVLFPAGRHTWVIQAAKIANDTGVDLVIGYVSYNSVHHLHRMFGNDKGQWQTGNGLSSIRDMFWYIALQNQSPVPGCHGYPDVVLAADCMTGQGTVEALVAIIRQLQWKQLTLLYHPKYEQISSTTINLLSVEGVKIYQYRVSDNPGLRQAINTSAMISTAETMNYLLFANQSFTFNTLEALQWFDNESGGSSSITTFSPWILWGEDLLLTRTAEKLGNLNNVVILQSIPCKNALYSSVPIELVPERILSDTVTAAKMKQLNSSCSLLSTAKQNANKLFLALQEKLSCGECLVDPTFKIYTAFWKPFGRRFDCVVNSVAKSKLNVSDVMIFPNTQFGLNNKSLVITTLPWPPYVYKNFVHGEAEYSGFCLDLIKELSHNLNFSYTITEPADQEWGRILNGKWTGLVGQMHRLEADLTVAALSVQPEREEVMDFISPYYTDYTVIILKKPAESSTKWKTLIDPFHWVVLVAIAVSLPFVTFFLTLCEKLSPYYSHIENRDKYPGLHNFSDCFWYLLGALLTQGGVYLPKSQSSRTITSFWWLFSIIVVATYSGNLIASLTVTRNLVPFNSVKEMVQQSTYKWGTTNGTYLNMLLQISKDPIYRQLWAGIKRFEVEDPDVLHPNHSVQVARVKAGHYAYLNDASSMNKELLTDCSLALVDEEFLPLHFAVGLRQNSPYRSIFDDRMVAISESGLLSIWKRKWWLRNSTCFGLLIRQAKPISLLDVQSAYYLLLIGITVAGLTTLTEKARKFLGNRKL